MDTIAKTYKKDGYLIDRDLNFINYKALILATLLRTYIFLKGGVRVVLRKEIRSMLLAFRITLVQKCTTLQTVYKYNCYGKME